MDKQITIVYLENNPLDRAVLDLHISQDPHDGASDFKLRYSYDGCLVEAKHILERDWRPSSTMILFDLGLSSGSENLLPDPAVRQTLGSQFLTKYLTSEGRHILPNERLDTFKKTHPAAWEYIQKIEGLSTLLKVRLAHPDLLCGIVSHYVGDDIRGVLEALVMHGWPIDSNQGEQPKPLVIHKGNLAGINQRLKATWEAWQAVRLEFYCKDVVQNSIVQAADGTAKSLVERVDLIRDNERLQPDDSESPIFICDFLGLIDLPHATLTLERLFKRAFPSLRVVKAKDILAMDRDGLYLFLDTEDRNLSLRYAIEQLRSAHDQQSPTQLVCIVRGRACDEAEAGQVFEGIRVDNAFWYTIPSMPVLMSRPALCDTFEFDRFVRAIVTSASEHAFFVRDSTVDGGERFLADLRGWVKALPRKSVPASLMTVWDCLCEAFEKKILTKTAIVSLFEKKASDERLKTDARAELGHRK